MFVGLGVCREDSAMTIREIGTGQIGCSEQQLSAGERAAKFAKSPLPNHQQGGSQAAALAAMAQQSSHFALAAQAAALYSSPPGHDFTLIEYGQCPSAGDSGHWRGVGPDAIVGEVVDGAAPHAKRSAAHRRCAKRASLNDARMAL